MTKITTNNKTILLVEVPMDAKNISVDKFPPYFHINYDLPLNENNVKAIGGFALFYKDFGGRDKYPKALSIIGEITNDTISFDCEPYVRSIFLQGDLFFKDYSIVEDKGSFAFWDMGDGKAAQESFYTLLKANGLYLENEFGKTKPFIYDEDAGTEREHLGIKWKQSEETRIKGKLLALEKIAKP